MDERIRKLWAADLRLPDAKQTKGVLNSEHGQCCLGRLCNLYIADTGQGVWVDYNPETTRTGSVEIIEHEQVQAFTLRQYGGADPYTPPLPVQNWAGISDVEIDAFASLNDDYGYTFELLAELIETGADVVGLCDAERAQRVRLSPS